MKEDLNNVTLVGAYGRKYKTKFAILHDFTAEKDFIICCVGHRWDNKPCSIKDMKIGDTITLRYNENKSAVTFTKKAEQNGTVYL